MPAPGEQKRLNNSILLHFHTFFLGTAQYRGSVLFHNCGAWGAWGSKVSSPSGEDSRDQSILHAHDTRGEPIPRSVDLPSTTMRPAVVCWLVFTASVQFTAGSLAPGIPTDNPVTTLYGEGTYAWTASINWTQVVRLQLIRVGCSCTATRCIVCTATACVPRPAPLSPKISVVASALRVGASGCANSVFPSLSKRLHCNSSLRLTMQLTQLRLTSEHALQHDCRNQCTCALSLHWMTHKSIQLYCECKLY